MTWERLLSPKRFRDSDGHETSRGTESHDKKNGRTAYQKDIDRIVFSRSFRRLGRKTQVHLLAKDDHIHTRLSHSLEVSCVGRSLGVMIGHWLRDERGERPPQKDFEWPSTLGEIVQAACLAHDIGNPPFGHAAEDAIRRWFQERSDDEARWKDQLKPGEIGDLRCFDGNAVAFRVIVHKEFYGEQGGMRLTYATLGALLKYPWTSHFAKLGKPKFSRFKTEYDSLCEIAGQLGLPEKTRAEGEHKAEYARHPLAYLVEAADDICYHVLDIEDAIELKLLPENTLYEGFSRLLEGDLSEEQRHLLREPSISWHTKNGLLRGKMMGRMTEEIAHVFTDHYDTIMEGRFERDLLSRSDGDSVCLAIEGLYEREKLAKKIYQNQRNIPLELGVYSLLRTLLEASWEAACELVRGGKLSYKTEIIKRFVKYDRGDQLSDKSLYRVIMLFLDYITGMTDEYATFVNRQLLGLGN